MRTSLNEIKVIEAYLTNTLPAGDRLVLEARILTDYSFRVNVVLQREVYKIVGLYQRQKIKKEAEKLHNDIFDDPSNVLYQERIRQLFISSL